LKIDPPPELLSRHDVFAHIGNLENIKFGKAEGKRKQTKPKLVYNWQKKSIFLNCRTRAKT